MDLNTPVKSKYEMAKFHGQKYDIFNVNERLLANPPFRLSQHRYKDEVINYVLDKAFTEFTLKDEYFEAMQHCLTNYENRETFLKMIEQDYISYNLNYMRPQEIERRNLRVVLPKVIYQNIRDIFWFFLECIKAEIISPLIAMQSNVQQNSYGGQA